MAACCATCGSSTPCVCDQQYTLLSGEALQRTLFRNLIPVVDGIRDLYACYGLRAYHVFLVWTRWSGGRRGDGVEQLEREQPLLPVPKISDLGAVGASASPIGALEDGTLTVSEISARYTEALLLGIDAGQLTDDQEFYYEVRFPQPDGRGARRRFYPIGTPNLEPEKFEWTVRLTRAYDDRSELGELPE